MLALMWQDTAFGETQEEMLFAECKSYNRFEKKDFDRMSAIAKEFPGAILAFCTLRKKLEPREIRELKRLTKTGMKYWKAERPINPVLILTGHELFDHVGAPHCWKDVAVPDWAKRVHSILELCNATQSIHLGLPHWHETWRQDFEKRRKRKNGLQQPPHPRRTRFECSGRSRSPRRRASSAVVSLQLETSGSRP